MSTTWNVKNKRRLYNLLKTKEIYNIPCALKLLSLDNEEWKHLMKCLSKNDMGGYSPGNQNDEEIYAEKEDWKMEALETVGFEALRICKNYKTSV